MSGPLPEISAEQRKTLEQVRERNASSHCLSFLYLESLALSVYECVWVWV